MASGSSARTNSGSKGFDFVSDDILCSYKDYGTQDSSNGNLSDPAVSSNSSKDYPKGMMARSSVIPPSSYSLPEDSFNQDVISTVEKSMKKYADNIMRFLEGISSRLSQLELYCYNVDKSVGEMISNLAEDREEADLKLRSLEKNLQEVHRSVQILRDKQELAEAQKELVKLQLVPKEPSTSSHSQASEDRVSAPASDPGKNIENSSETQNQQLALALPHHVAPQPQPVSPCAQASRQNFTQQQPQQPYYLPSNQPAHAQYSQSQYMTSDPQYRTPQPQDASQASLQPTHSQVSQTVPAQTCPQYQQQWPQGPQQLPQQVQLSQQPPMQTQMRPPSSTPYTSYTQNQPSNPSIPETLPNSMPLQVPYSSVPQPGSSRVDTVPYGYGGIGRAIPQQPQPPQIKGTYGVQSSEGYASAGPHPPIPPGNAYVMYDGEGGGRPQYSLPQPQFSPGGYPPANVSLQNPQQLAGPNPVVGNPGHTQFIRKHPYSELIEQLVSMGFRSDHVASVIQRMEESRQPVDFNSVLDRLNAHSSSGPQRGWSG